MVEREDTDPPYLGVIRYGGGSRKPPQGSARYAERIWLSIFRVLDLVEVETDYGGGSSGG